MQKLQLENRVRPGSGLGFGFSRLRTFLAVVVSNYKRIDAPGNKPPQSERDSDDCHLKGNILKREVVEHHVDNRTACGRAVDRQIARCCKGLFCRLVDGGYVGGLCHDLALLRTGGRTPQKSPACIALQVGAPELVSGLLGLRRPFKNQALSSGCLASTRSISLSAPRAS